MEDPEITRRYERGFTYAREQLPDDSVALWADFGRHYSWQGGSVERVWEAWNGE